MRAFLILSAFVGQALSLAIDARNLVMLRGAEGRSFVASAVSGPSTTNGTLENVQDTRYAIVATVNGRNFSLLVDTGSSDIFVITNGTLPVNTTDSQALSFSYGGGLINGTSAFADVSIGGYEVANQAILTVNASGVGVADVLNLGLDGLVGVSFSGNDASFLFQALGEPGQPFLFNVFDQTPQLDNFMAMSLSRTDDLEDSADASYTVNEQDPLHAEAVRAAAPQPLWPGVDVNGRWSIVVDSIWVDDILLEMPPSAVPGTPEGKMVALVDSGTPTGALPPALWYALYANIPNATISESEEALLIPCETTSIVTIVIGGVPMSLHPLDLSTIIPGPIPEIGLGNNSICTTSIDPSPASPGDIDAIFGDSMMRNFYTVFNFGSTVAHSPSPNASMQFVPLTDPVAAQADVVNVRMADFASGAYPPELTTPLAGFVPADPNDPPAFLNITSSEDSSSGSSAKGSKSALDTTGGSNSNSSSNSSFGGTYANAIIGLLAANLLLVVVLLVLGILNYRRGRSSGSRADGGKYYRVPLPGAGKREAEAEGFTDSEFREQGRYSD
ncbi:Acid protease [Mycena chlorophos]|uniref:Acid protease n=1 Tax=Mycena chlorophos TaxID=658473 RepID=A0A8H6VWB2_MYCCL|nr:Acid protease [Mycena chlorophos]